MAKLDPDARMLAVAYTQCIAAEATRAEVFAGRQAAQLLYPVAWGDTLAAALQARQQGEALVAAPLYDQVFDEAPATSGTADTGLEFGWVADADPRLGPVTEAMIAGRYGLMPFCALESLTISPPADLRDTVWIQAEFGIVGAARVAGFIPLRYPGSEASGDAALVRGAATGWSVDAGGEFPLGHRLFAFSDGSEVPVQGLRELTLHTA
jgi:type VI secretion system protein ImpE